MSKKTVVVGASTNPGRYAYLAAQSLTSNNHELVLLSIHKGLFNGSEFLDLHQRPSIQNVDTLTLYINPYHQQQWEEYFLSLRPKRIIFNPGTENPTLEAKAEKQGIETIYGCTLVMLNTGQY